MSEESYCTVSTQEGAPANRGVLDWIAGLEWVQRNIREFGGDPDRVIISGQSAGGGAGLTLLEMERAQHLFSGVHSISGAIGALSRRGVLVRLPRLEGRGTAHRREPTASFGRRDA